MIRLLTFAAGLAPLRAEHGKVALDVLRVDDECIEDGSAGICSVNALQRRASAKPADGAEPTTKQEDAVAASLAQDAGAGSWGYGYGYGGYAYGHGHHHHHHRHGRRYGYGGWLQAESSSESECTDCSCCQDGCLDEAGKCQKDDGDLGACFKGVETGRAFTICEKDAPVKLKATLTAPVPDTCSACTGGCVTPKGCQKVDGQDATLMDCIIEALDVEGVSFCGESPQSIVIEEEGAPPSLAQEDWGYGAEETPSLAEDATTKDLGYGYSGHGHGHGHHHHHHHGNGGWLQTEPPAERAEDSPSLAQEAGTGTEDWGYGYGGHGHGHGHHHHHHGHGHRYGYGGWLQTESPAESAEDSPSLAQEAGTEDWGYGYGGHGHGHGHHHHHHGHGHRYGYGGWLQTESPAESAEDSPSLAQEAGTEDLGYGYGSHGHGHDHHHHRHHHGHGHRHGYGGWLQTESAAESAEDSPSLAQEADTEDWGYGHGGYGRRGYGYGHRGYGYGGWGRRYRRRYGYYGWR